jgi:EmrB/QacA subfamily drug resistance transporter
MSQIGKPPCDEALIERGARAAPCPPAARRWVLAAAILGSSMAFVDGTVVNVALPAIQRALQASASEAQWVVESYALFLAALLLVGGALGDRFGRRRVFTFGVALFGLASVACALAAGAGQLIAARAVQGVGAALLVPGSLALISANFPPAERGRAIGTWSGFSGITAALGPVLGGFLIDHFSWTWAFLINVPLALAVLVIAWTRVPESRAAQDGARLDVPGALLATLALGGVVYACIEAPTRGWGAPGVLGALLAGVAAALAFAVVERRARHPMLPLELFRVRNFAGANLLTLCVYAALGGGVFFLPLNLIQVQGYGATAAGAALLPFILIMFGFSRWAGTLVERFGSKPPLVAGPLIAALGFALFAAPDLAPGEARYWTSFFPAVVVLGAGMTVTVAPLTTTVMNSVSPQAAGVASGVNNAVARTAALLAIAVFGLVLARAYDANLGPLLEAAGASREAAAFLQAQRDQLAGSALPPGEDAAALGRAVKLAYVAGFRWVMLLSAGLALLSALAAWAWIERRPAAA